MTLQIKVNYASYYNNIHLTLTMNKHITSKQSAKTQQDKQEQ